ncbi:MAG: nucleotide sugar dehydrogenase [Proteobacteria bacterium]|nr:nucleotide sugar dehydrogenase [Pseudomonadota bacterium]
MLLNRTVSIIGLGYVGLPVAVAFGKRAPSIGFDINPKRLQELRNGIDNTGEVLSEELSAAEIRFTDSTDDLKKADFHIVAVPTPINEARQPDLTPLTKASETVGKALKPGDIVVYESTVYPGATEEECVPILEAVSGLECGVDFKVGYSPERINPGDKEHTFTKILKVVSGQDEETLETIARVYESVVAAGVYRAPSIKVAEAAKVIENTQRDLNIAFVNELAVIFDMMDIDTQEVLAAAGTKWNFLPFTPGLVGGHCIGVDPYYLTHKAEKLGYSPQVILAGRKINDDLGKFVAQRTIKEMIHAGHQILGSTVTVLGLTFKENCPDLRNSRVIDIIRELREFGVTVQVQDDWANAEEAQQQYGITLTPLDVLKPADALIIAVAHQSYVELSPQMLEKLLPQKGVVIDVKGVVKKETLENSNIRLWRL